MLLDHDRCYRAVRTKDTRFDGRFVTAVRTTGIYCRPSCPAVTPKRSNVTFFPTAAAAQLAGFRACKRCRPDATPGSPEWDLRTDVVGRAMRLIADGVIDREGVSGLAARLHYSERHLHRQLVAELGAGPQALARAQRAEAARTLIETTDVPFSDIAFAAGFASIRQFNDTVRSVFAATPTDLRRRPARATKPRPGAMRLRLPFRSPFDASNAVTFIGARAVAGLEEWDGTTYRRTLRLPHGSGIVELEPAADHVACTLALTDLRDLTAAVNRCRSLLDLDADPVGIDEALGESALLAPLVERRPGIRIPRSADGFELAVRAILGQQISVAGARTMASRLVAAYGTELDEPAGTLTHTWPSPETIAGASLDELRMPATRKNALRALAGAVASEEIDLAPGSDRAEVEAALLALPGVGPWTASYVAMRALGDPDAFLPSDLGVRRGLERLGLDARPKNALAVADGWRPWRSYAVMHLWNSLSDPPVEQRAQKRRAS
ncbi:MAG TPA: AlkA N-terminal domain-containing protein [Actinomycetota bacterium]|nr:AlkA N-terminal domain-containing protein [Actinomycetota bacterium]